MTKQLKRAAIILAAGQGTRMKSPLPKVLHRLAGRTLLDRAIDSALSLKCAPIIVVVGAHSPEVGDLARARLGPESVVIQDPPLGTGHAVLAAKEALADFDGQVIVTYADCPLMSAEVLQPVFDLALTSAVAVMGFTARDPGAYGRLIMTGDRLDAIVEAREASDDQLLIKTCNSGVLATSNTLLFSLLSEVTNKNAKGEYYLTDIVSIAKARGLTTRVTLGDEDDIGGVNNQNELAAMESVWQQRQRQAFMHAGVTLQAPDTVFFSWDTMMAPGVTLEPNIVFGPGVRIEAGAVIRAFTHLEGAQVGTNAIIGPYARLRPGADIGSGAHIGNFVEVKNVKIGNGAKANHLSYLGDGEVGSGTNIGAGTIFCNYDGFFKHQTHIGAGAFIGSNTLLVAPVSIGDGAMTGSGSVITRDVPADALALGRAPQSEKSGWAKAFRAQKSAQKSKS
jgi:bifunctional UDP-N-acetylglucosamine pyrophosphorylase / glucosamine-1-phosphate N-acetyltransferase